MSTYKYTIELQYLDTTKLTATALEAAQVKSLIIDRRFDEANMPEILISVALDKNMIDDMILNSNKNLINLTIYNNVSDSDISGIKSIYIREQFTYIMVEDINYDKDVDYAGDNSERTDIYKLVTIGLIKKDNIQNNKKTFNGIIKNTNSINVLQTFTSHLKMIIEPLHFNTEFTELILPPLTSVSKAIRYLNSIAVLYRTTYRFFMDFDYAYILSSSGVPVKTQTDVIQSVLFNIKNTTEYDANVTGMYTNTKQKNYQIDVNSVDTVFSIDKVTEKSYDTVTTVASTGKIADTTLDINNSDYFTNKTEMIRISNDNTNMVENIKSDTESHSITVSINKNDLDSSVLTLNREYIIKNYDSHSGSDGRFLLSRKRELFYPEDDYFVMNTMMDFRIVK